MTEQLTQTSPGPIVAGAARDFRLKRFALVAVLLIYGGMSIRDGFFKYPRENAAATAKGYSDLPHPGLDVQFNEWLGILLPPLSLVFLGWTLYISRGAYRFDGAQIDVPGHPPIPVTALLKLDRAKWERKGIAYVDYQIPGSAKEGRFKLDDFIYSRQPTDEIFERIEAMLAAGKSTG